MKQGILEPVEFAEWAAPIAPVVKSDKFSVHICGDFKLTVNKASKLDQYPIPRIEDLALLFVVTHALELCWTIPWAHVSSGGRCTVKVVRSIPDARSHLSSNYPTTYLPSLAYHRRL